MSTKTYPAPSTTEPASAKQISYLDSLVDQREVDFTIPPTMTEAQASELIDRALTFPRRATRTVGPGHYVYNGSLYRVRERKTGPGVYAELWRADRGSWKYIPRLVTNFQDKHAVSDKLAAEMMKVTT